MKKIIISEVIREAVPEVKLGIITANVKYEKFTQALWDEIAREEERIKQIPLERVKEIPTIASSREAYKRLGKAPARYRLSAEALHRRIIQGKGLYQINNLVDTINLASLKTGYSIGGYDSDKIQGDTITFDMGRKDDDYTGIGRGKLNIENLPVFRDALGPFGSPTSDSERTMITENTERVMWIVFNFGGHEYFDKDLEIMASLVEKYNYGKNIDVDIV